MAKKLKINYVKQSGSGTLLAKMRVKVDISPDRWDDLINGMKFWYRVDEDPTDETHVEVSCFKWKKSSDGKWIWYWARIGGLTPLYKYHIIATALGESGVRYKSSVTIAIPSETGGDNVIFAISNKYGEWEDFTDCIPVPDYKVNNTEIVEEWEDGNYDLHSNVVQTRIKGTLTLKFRDRLRMNKFLECLAYNENRYGKGRVRLKVQVNNELDFDDEDEQSPLP